MPEDLKFNATLDPAAFAAGMAKVESLGKAAGERVSSSFGSALSSLTGPIAAVGSAVAAAFATKSIISGVASVFDAGRALAQMSRATGANAEGLVILQSKFKQAGLEGNAVAGAIFKLQKSMQGLEEDGSENKGAPLAIRELGLEVEKLRDMDPAAQLFAVGKAIGGISDPAERTATAMKIFGKSGGELGAAFRQADFGTVSTGLQKKAEMMAKNAAIFEQVSIKLEKVGGVLKTFYAGVADRVVTTLAPILDRLEKINLVAIGQQFGDGIAKGAQMFIGAFSDPELVAKTLVNGLTAGVLSVGNVLIATLKSGGGFFKDGLLDSLQGIGSAIVATLMEAFDKPIRYLQAGVEAALQTAQYLADKASGKQDDTSGLGAMSPAERKDYYEKQQSVMHNRFRQLAHDQLVDPDNMSDREAAGVAGAAVNDPTYKNAQGEYERARHYDPDRYARAPQTMQEIMDARAKDPTRFGLYGGQTAAEWHDRAKEQGSAGWQSAMSAIRGFHVDDVFGAGGYANKAASGGNRLAALGRRTLGVGSPSSMASTAVAVGRAVVPHVDQIGSAMDRYNSAFNASHRMGQTMLDVDPSAKPGWTGARDAFAGFHAADPNNKEEVARAARERANYFGTSGNGYGGHTALTSGGLGGGAYGRTGNIMTQVSGRVGGDKDHMATVAGHRQKLVQNSDAMLSMLGEGGSSSGGGGATVTG